MFAHILCRTIHSVQRTLPIIIGSIAIAMLCSRNWLKQQLNTCQWNSKTQNVYENDSQPVWFAREKLLLDIQCESNTIIGNGITISTALAAVNSFEWPHAFSDPKISGNMTAVYMIYTNNIRTLSISYRIHNVHCTHTYTKTMPYSFDWANKQPKRSLSVWLYIIECKQT